MSYLDYFKISLWQLMYSFVSGHHIGDMLLPVKYPLFFVFFFVCFFDSSKFFVSVLLLIVTWPLPSPCTALSQALAIKFISDHVIRNGLTEMKNKERPKN